MYADRSSSAQVEILDGTSERDRSLLAKFPVVNGTRPASVTSRRNAILIRFSAAKLSQSVVYMEVTIGHDKKYDLNVTSSVVVENNGRGIWVENMRSMVHVVDSQVERNTHVAGINVWDGVGDVNVTRSVIRNNEGDGLNMTYAGGARNVSFCDVSYNKGRGVAVWYNETSTKQPFVQETNVAYTILSNNLEHGVFVGNFCGPAIVNITGNKFLFSTLSPAVELWSCRKETKENTTLQLGHNKFEENRLAVRLDPILNMFGSIEWNEFRAQSQGGVLIRNRDVDDEEELLPCNLTVSDNIFSENRGLFAASFTLAQPGDKQALLFTRNFLQENVIQEPFSNLNPRSRVAAVVAVGSANIQVVRNVFNNHRSKYEIGSHLEDPSSAINCSMNWLGFTSQEKIYDRLFDRKDRYNLARLHFKPYLLVASSPDSDFLSDEHVYVPQFGPNERNEIGGEVEGKVYLTDRYGKVMKVHKDIYVRPGRGELFITPGIVLQFENSIGMMVGGRLHAEGDGGGLEKRVTFTFQDQVKGNVTSPTVRLVGGSDARQGRLQVQMGGRWGTVCRKGWTIEAASIVCRQLGYALNPIDWLLEKNELPPAGTNDDILLSNVRCSDLDTDILLCRLEGVDDFEDSCDHSDDVGLRCYDISWAGIRLGVTASKSTIRHALIEGAGLVDPGTNLFRPAIQMDFAHHILDQLTVSDNWADGVGVIHTDLYSFEPDVNILSRSTVSNNRGNGIVVRTPGLEVLNCQVHHNHLSGVAYNPVLSRDEQRELVGWVKLLPGTVLKVATSIMDQDFTLETDQPILVSTEGGESGGSTRKIRFETKQDNVISMTLLSPVHPLSSESVLIFDHVSMALSERILDLRRDALAFPGNSSSFAFTLTYTPGSYPVGEAILMLKAVPVAYLPRVPGNFLGPIPTLKVKGSQLVANQRGISTLHFNTYLGHDRGRYLRHLKARLEVIDSRVHLNKEEAVFVHSPLQADKPGNLSEFLYMFNDTRFTENKKVIAQFSRDIRDSHNLFDWVFKDCLFEGTVGGGVSLSLPYVWQYNENYTHSVYMMNCTHRYNRQYEFTLDGHFAKVEMVKSVFENNDCQDGLISILGMEKEMYFAENEIRENKGRYMLEFDLDSQSEIMGVVQGNVKGNLIQDNQFMSSRKTGMVKGYQSASCVLMVKGVQRLNITHNLFGRNRMDYELLTGIRTASINNSLNVRENWWGSSDVREIRRRIFDFDDWNSNGVAEFIPFYTRPVFESPLHHGTGGLESEIDLDRLSGRIFRNLHLQKRPEPYVIRADLTIMPNVTLTIDPGVRLQFYPSVGILVLGVLRAMGLEHDQIVMEPVPRATVERGEMEKLPRKAASVVEIDEESSNPKWGRSGEIPNTLRLCIEGNCSSEARSGFLEFYNQTTLQWIPMCDRRFSERNIQVACRQVGFPTINTFSEVGPRLDVFQNTIDPIISWPEPVQCEGFESRLEECPVRLRGEWREDEDACHHEGDFLFISCGKRVLASPDEDYWGGIRFSIPLFEAPFYFDRFHDHDQHNHGGAVSGEDSHLERVVIRGAGVLHGEMVPAVETVFQNPRIHRIIVNESAWDGIRIVAPVKDLKLLNNLVENNGGVGVTVLVLNGEGQKYGPSSFAPLSSARLSYSSFGLVDMCDTNKELVVEQRVLVYYKYDSRPADCVKIFKSRHGIKNFGFRMLYFNLFNATKSSDPVDKVTLYDGDIYNITSRKIGEIVFGRDSGREFYTTRDTESSLSVHVHASGGGGHLGFMAEVVTLPVSTIGFGRDVHHNISFSEIRNNSRGALLYGTAGEVNPILTVEMNRVEENGIQIYGNFSSCPAALVLDVQNTPNLFFKNNLVRNNQGGLLIYGDSSNAATALKARITNSLFTGNQQNEVIKVIGRGTGSFQEVTVANCYITQNYVPFKDVVSLYQVVSNLSHNYIRSNHGQYILSVQGFSKVRLPIYQTVAHNGFTDNVALERERSATVVVGSAGQQYVHNIFWNPENSLELMTLNMSEFEQDPLKAISDVWKTPVDAKYNYWGYNNSLVVQGRIRDKSDEEALLSVDFTPFLMNNESLLSGACPPRHQLIGDTCYMYIGAPMTFQEARDFCKSDNSSMPYVTKGISEIYRFIRDQEPDFRRYDMVWVQHYDVLDECAVLMDYRIQQANCDYKLPFICETDTNVEINPLRWLGTDVALAALGVICGVFLLLLILILFWLAKSKRREKEKLQRRNSIRSSLRSSRSIISSPSYATDYGYGRRRMMIMDGKSTVGSQMTGLTGVSGIEGSIDSIEKRSSQFNATSSAFDTSTGFNTYEARNPVLESSAGYENPYGGYRTNGQVLVEPHPGVVAYGTHRGAGGSIQQTENPYGTVIDHHRPNEYDPGHHNGVYGMPPSAAAMTQNGYPPPEAQYTSSSSNPALAYENRGFRDISMSSPPSKAPSLWSDPMDSLSEQLAPYLSQSRTFNIEDRQVVGKEDSPPEPSSPSTAPKSESHSSGAAAAYSRHHHQHPGDTGYPTSSSYDTTTYATSSHGDPLETAM
ncbi:unnamed protein product [Cyprideis torosa]|uniref:Uncharacterized protein n=1 Tax=Cyprideis torosa TaxID=163714 RepID=A0A7R8WCQ8_9CRUS|nr:unnamed protein product [Cyprideis torosa]CAG0893659.1 unnamed protein product [Cyprideis torosa]